LTKVARLDLLADVYGRITVPEEVYREITAGDHPAAQVIHSANWLQIEPVRDPRDVFVLSTVSGLGVGECAAIILAEELAAELTLIDDLPARQLALSRGLHLGGTIGTLLTAKRLGLLPGVKDVLDEWIRQGTHISRHLYQIALSSAGE
jgi:predicted nucleic acid-binding protein